MPRLVVNKRHQEPYDIYIGRGSIWGNPYTSKNLEDTKADFQAESKEDSIRKFKKNLVNRPDLIKQMPSLKGKILACYCKPSVCHGDVISSIAEHLDFIFHTRKEVSVESATMKGKVVKDPKFSFLHDCTDDKCIDIHLKILWENDEITVVCLSQLRKISDTTAFVSENEKQAKPISLFDL